jgi:hypothetical protein
VGVPCGTTFILFPYCGYVIYFMQASGLRGMMPYKASKFEVMMFYKVLKLEVITLRF